MQGTLQLPAGRRRQPVENRFHKLGRQQWHVQMRERYPHGTGVLIDLARYGRGGPLANQRLVASAHGEVTCHDRVNGEASDRRARGLMTWPIAAFIGRSRLHVPAPGTRVVRSYGLYAPTQPEAVAMCRAHLGPGPVVPPSALDWQTACQDRGDAHPARGPVCGRQLVCLGVILPLRIPPPSAIPWEVVA